MYAWLWRHLPGPVPVRLLLVLTVLGAVTIGCLEYVFPVVSPMLPFEDMVVGVP